MNYVNLHHGMYYHIYNRGNNRETLFREDRNYNYFLYLYKKYIYPIADLYAYCLLPNHFHFLVQIKEFDEMDQMFRFRNEIKVQFATFFGTYTKSINSAYQRSGTLFEGRFIRKLIGSTDQFYQTIAYIHQNPQKHSLVSDYQVWPYSSYWSYLRRENNDLLSKEAICDTDMYESIMSLHKNMLMINEDFKDA